MFKAFAASAALLLLCASVGPVAGQGARPPASGGGSFGGSGSSGGGGFGGSGGSSGSSGGGGFGGSGGSGGGGSNNGFGGSGGSGGGGSSGFGGSGGSSSGGGSSGGFGGSGGSSGGGGSSSGGFGGSGGSFQAIQMCKRMVPKKDAVFTTADIPCKGQPRCQVCGGPDKVRDACAAAPTCVAFSYQVSTQCGLLKSKASTNIMVAPQRDWITYAGGGVFPQQGVAAASILDLCVTLRPLADKNVLGFDGKCDGKDTCEVCGTLDKIRTRCAGSANCKGFTWDPSRNCGFLKHETTQGAVSQKGWITYTRA